MTAAADLATRLKRFLATPRDSGSFTVDSRTKRLEDALASIATASDEVVAEDLKAFAQEALDEREGSRVTSNVEKALWEWLDKSVPEVPNIQASGLPAVRSAFEQGYIKAQIDVMATILVPLVEERAGVR